jgi:hypothetical protein
MNYPFYQNPGVYPNYSQQPQQNQVNATQPTMPKVDMPMGFFVPVANENVARNYPVGYGNTVIFKDENSPRMYVKAMGYSQLESPIFEKYVREEDKPISDDVNEKANTLSYDDLKAEIDGVKGDIKWLKDRIQNRNNEKRSDKQ